MPTPNRNRIMLTGLVAVLTGLVLGTAPQAASASVRPEVTPPTGSPVYYHSASLTCSGGQHLAGTVDWVPAADLWVEFATSGGPDAQEYWVMVPHGPETRVSETFESPYVGYIGRAMMFDSVSGGDPIYSIELSCV